MTNIAQLVSSPFNPGGILLNVVFFGYGPNRPISEALFWEYPNLVGTKFDTYLRLFVLLTHISPLWRIYGSNDNYVAVERITSHEAYRWMVDFVDEMVALADENAAEKLSIALNGKGVFRRFKETLHRVDEQWLQAWYQWRDKQFKATVEKWLKSVLSPDE